MNMKVTRQLWLITQFIIIIMLNIELVFNVYTIITYLKMNEPWDWQINFKKWRHEKKTKKKYSLACLCFYLMLNVLNNNNNIILLHPQFWIKRINSWYCNSRLSDHWVVNNVLIYCSCHSCMSSTSKCQSNPVDPVAIRHLV